MHPPAHFLSPSAKGNQNDMYIPLTPESIADKLKRAEDRRLSLEQLRSTLLAAENSRPVEVTKIKDQQAEGLNNKTCLSFSHVLVHCRFPETNGGKTPEETRISQGES